MVYVLQLCSVLKVLNTPRCVEGSKATRWELQMLFHGMHKINIVLSYSQIDTYYVDGVILTHGSSPRRHIWIFACADSEDDQDRFNKCPCTNAAITTRVSPPPSFVGNDYFYDTAALTGFSHGTFYNGDQLYDGTGCGTNSTCCSFNSPPWFYKQLPQVTTDDIYIYIWNNEDIAIEIVEIYVQ